MSLSLKRVLLVFTLLFLCIIFVYSKSGESHAKDMAAVLGLYSFDRHKRESNQNLEGLMPLLNLINMMIDDAHTKEYFGKRTEKYSNWGEMYSDFSPSDYYTLGSNLDIYNQLKMDFNFGWGSYGHRLMFHWGFERQTDMNSGSLTRAILQKNGNDYPIDRTKELIDFVYEIQNERMITMRTAIDDFFGLKNRNVTRGIAAILYYTHLLGDHIEAANDKTSEAVLNPNLILNAIDGTYLKLLTPSNLEMSLKGRKAKKAIQNLRLEMNDLRKSQDGKTQYAQRLLDLLIKYMPSVMEFWIGKPKVERNYKYW